MKLRIVVVLIISLMVPQLVLSAHSVYPIQALNRLKEGLSSFLTRVQQDQGKATDAETFFEYFKLAGSIHATSEKLDHILKEYKLNQTGRPIVLNDLVRALTDLQKNSLVASQYKDYSTLIGLFTQASAEYKLKDAVAIFAEVQESLHLLEPRSSTCEETETPRSRVNRLLNDSDLDAFETVKMKLETDGFIEHKYHIKEFFPTPEDYRELLLAEKIQPMIEKLLKEPRLGSSSFERLSAYLKQPKDRRIEEGVHDSIFLAELLLTSSDDELNKMDLALTPNLKQLYLSPYEVTSFRDLKEKMFQAIHDDFIVVDHNKVPNETKQIVQALQTQGKPVYDVVLSRLFGSACLHGFSGLLRDIHSKELFLREVTRVREDDGRTHF